MKTNRHSLMAKGIMVLLTLLILVFVFTYAWFLDGNAPSYASGLTLKTELAAEVNLAVGFSTPDTGNEYMISEFTSDNNSKIDFERIVVPRTITLHASDPTVVVNNNITGTANSATYNLLANFAPVDLTGDGVNLYRPEMESKNTKIKYTATTVDEDVTANKQYITFDLYTRSNLREYTVKLDTGSYVVAAAEVSAYEDAKLLATQVSDGVIQPTLPENNVDYGRLVGNSVTRKSSYGDFSEDSVVGAVRMAFTQFTKPANVGTMSSDEKWSSFFSDSEQLNSSKSRLWIPRSDMFLQDTNNINDWVLHTANDNNWSSGTVNFRTVSSSDITPFDEPYKTAILSNMGTSRASVTYEQLAQEHWYYSKTQLINGATAKNRYVKYTNPIVDIATSNTVIIETDSTYFDGEYYYGKCRVNLWIEGCDAEARKAIDGGSFLFGLELTAD